MTALSTILPEAERHRLAQLLTSNGLDPGLLDADLDDVVAQTELTVALASAHAATSGSHTHSHAAYGAQGDDRTHEHMHAHSGDASHAHDHQMQVPSRPMAAAGFPVGQQTMIAAGVEAAGASLVADAQPAIAAAAEAGGLSLVAAAMQVLGSPWGIEQRGDEAWELLSTDGERGTFATYQDAIAELGTLAFVDGARPVLAETWRSEMAYEGVQTGDGRYIEPGALAYRDTPMPLMLQTVTDIGHFGAILCGTILAAATVQQTAQGSGELDDSDAGRQALQVIQARSRFGVSIDGVSPVEAEFECTERDEYGDCIDGRVKFTLLTIGGLTMTPFPAFADAYIALEQRAATADGSPETTDGAGDPPCTDCGDQPAEPNPRVDLRDGAGAGHVAAGKAEPSTFTAAGPAALPVPSSAFADPGFRHDDGRVVLQPDGVHYACPHTVTADGRVFGHMAGWFTCHTGYADRCVTPPRSQTGYAAFMLRPVLAADGEVVRVGHLTMGCGHASTDGHLSVDSVRAHYDGGPGAVRMAHVACGEDEFGIWYAGCVNPEATPEQVREFAACSVSGDWREVWRNRGLDLVACLAGVTVPGFPVASALAAAGLRVVDADGALPRDPIATWVDGRPEALVAAGVVRRPLPWETAIAAACAKIDQLERRVRAAERVTSQLRPLAAAALASGLAIEPAGVSATNGAAV